MPRLKLIVGGRPYEISCSQGEEEHITGLATKLDKRVLEMRQALPQASDTMLLLVTALMLENELSNNTQNPEKISQTSAEHIENVEFNRPSLEKDIEQRVSQSVSTALAPLIKKLEALAISLENS